MNKKLQVFVSSTYTDLIEERQAAVEAILDAGHIPAGMELFKAGKSQMETIKKWIDESDVYMLILGGRYGSIEEESGLSYTELEYRYALTKNMPVFAIVLDDSFLHIKAASLGKDTIFENNNANKYNFFKKYVKAKIVKFVSNIYELTSIIHSHLNYIMENEKIEGWVKFNSLDYDFNSLYTFFNKMIISKLNDSDVNVNQFLIENAYLFNYGTDISIFKNIRVLLVFHILEIVDIPDSMSKNLQFTELGYKYYKYLLNTSEEV